MDPTLVPPSEPNQLQQKMPAKQGTILFVAIIVCAAIALVLGIVLWKKTNSPVPVAVSPAGQQIDGTLQPTLIPGGSASPAPPQPNTSGAMSPAAAALVHFSPFTLPTNVTFNGKKLPSPPGFTFDPPEYVDTSNAGNYVSGVTNTAVDPQSGKSAVLLSHWESEDQKLLGVPGHMDAYTGTKLTMNKPYTVEYVGLKMDPAYLVSPTKIEFSHSYWGKMDDMSYQSEHHTGVALVDKILLTPYALASGGPPWLTEMYGSSRLWQDKTDGDIQWYKLSSAIRVKPADLVEMQIYYLPSGQTQTAGVTGNVTIAVAGLVMTDTQGTKYVSVPESAPIGTVFTPYPDFQSEGGDVKYVDAYRAIIVPEEKGSLEIVSNPGTNTIDLVVRNDGKDPITLDNDSFDFIANYLTRRTITGFRVRDGVGNLVADLPLFTVINKLQGTTILPDQFATIPIISDSKLKIASPLATPMVGDTSLPDGVFYQILLNTSGPDNDSYYNYHSDRVGRIIQWTFKLGDYFYPRFENGSEAPLYDVSVNNNVAQLIPHKQF